MAMQQKRKQEEKQRAQVFKASFQISSAGASQILKQGKFVAAGVSKSFVVILLIMIIKQCILFYIEDKGKLKTEDVEGNKLGLTY